MDTTVLVLIVVVGLLLIIGAVVLVLPQIRRKRRSEELQDRFGPEYERVVDTTGDRRSAEDELLRRQEHRAQLDIRPLEPEERRRYADAWHEVQKRFVDSPDQAIGEADELVSRVMRDRGYPVDDFAQRAEDLSVDHPGVVQDYRAANRVAVAHGRGQATTEDLRQALVHYRSLFDRLLEDGQRSRDAHDSSRKEVR